MEWNRPLARRQKTINRGQSLGELAILLALIAAVLIGMQAYLKRGLQARYKAVVDSAADAFTHTGSDGVITSLRQYEPYYASSVFTATAMSDTNLIQAEHQITALVNDTSTRSGQQSVGHNFGGDDGWDWQ